MKCGKCSGDQDLDMEVHMSRKTSLAGGQSVGPAERVRRKKLAYQPAEQKFVKGANFWQ